jgi:cell division protease FtsH
MMKRGSIVAHVVTHDVYIPRPTTEMVRSMRPGMGLSSRMGMVPVRAPPLLMNISYGEFMKDVEKDSGSNQIERVVVTDDKTKLTVFTKDGSEDDVDIPKISLGDLYDKLIAKGIDLVYSPDKNRNIAMAADFFLQYGLIFLIGFVAIQTLAATRGGGGGAGGANSPFNFGKSKALLSEEKDIKVKFADVAGCEDAKADLQEVVDFLKNPTKYSVLGAKIPKGCLLAGPPGTGKTLLAKAIAGEAGVPFFSCSASEFVELFVGVGASRVRDLFVNANKVAPCIIFIDEIDAIGKARGNQPMMGGNDEREQTINQLLTEMDGFKENTGVIVIAATNRADILDAALLRPGRFDRRITVEYPDCAGRAAILAVHTKNKPIDSTVCLESIAKVTAGYSGADLANLANEAAILSARRNKEKITMAELEDALEKIVLGAERKSIASEEKRKLVAYHEAGHALVALKVGTFDKVRKVTIIPRGKAGGVTMFEPDMERLDSGLYTREYLLNQIAVALGGRVAEEIAFGHDNVTTGASSDIERVQQVARLMVTMYGLSDKIGPIAWKAGSAFEPKYSEAILYEIDSEVQAIVQKCYAMARDILVTNRGLLDTIALKLIILESLSGEELREIAA